MTGGCPDDEDDVKCCIVDFCSGTDAEGHTYSWCAWTSDECPGTRLDSESLVPAGFGCR
jgi:hypothetical protein